MANAVAGPSGARRPTRSSGLPDSFVPLAGAPRPGPAKAVYASDSASSASTSSDTDSEGDVEAALAKPAVARTYVKAAGATPTKRAPPAASSSPYRPAGVGTPSPTKRRALAVRPEAGGVESPQSAKQRRTRVPVLDHDDSDESDDELLLGDPSGTPRRIPLPASPTKASASARHGAGLLLGSAASASASAHVFPPSSPTKPRTPAKQPTPRTPTSQRTQQTTPRSSARVRGLPINQADIQAVPRSLKSNLAGWHARDFGVKPIGESSEDESEEEGDEDGDDELVVVGGTPKGKEVAAVAVRRVGPRPEFPAKAVLELIGPLQRVLAGTQPPKVAQPEAEADAKKMMAFPCLDGYEAWERPVRYAMEGVVKDGVGNCLILLGQRGVGKTMLVERSLRILEQVYGRDAFIPVRLNGLVHTTDRQALRAIARQLKVGGFDNDDDGGDGGEWGSNAALMTSLLRMLEPPASDAAPTKPIVLVVDEFDLFALHPRQSFLYCLLDIVQGNRRKGGMGVIGLSSRTDCLSILEKRVRSRCQSQVHQMALPNRFDAFAALAATLLTVEGGRGGTLADAWNEEVAAFVADKETRAYLDRLWKLHGNVPTHLRQALAAMLHKVEFAASHSTPDWTSPAPASLRIPQLDTSLLPAPSDGAKRAGLLSHVSLLDLHVCVAAKHVRAQQLAVGGACTLELLYDCYRSHLARGKLGIATKHYSRQAFAMAFDRLVGDELFLPLTGKPAHHAVPSRASGFKLWRFVPWAAMVQEECEARREAPVPLKRWAKDWSG